MESKIPDPSPAPPAQGIGFPSRDRRLDVLKGFKNPPPGYGEVAFYWWLGDPLTRDRLKWQLEQLKGKGIMGLQINYAHSDKGGSSYGLTYPSDPPLFSEDWWGLVKWFVGEAKKEGMAVSLSDYTLGIGQGWKVDEALKAHPEMQGFQLEHTVTKVPAGESVSLKIEPGTLCLSAIDDSGKTLDILPPKAEGLLQWTAPKGSDWTVVAVWPRRVTPSIDPMNPASGKAIVEHFFQPFETRNPGEAGKGLNFFFSDELGFGVSGRLWNAQFADAFRKRKGYDIRPQLALLFVDGGPRTPKVRLDYNDVLVSLSEENYFKPVFNWHQKRGMIYGCDHGGRGRDVTEFGDYFRTQRWNQGPGCDQPALSRDLIKNKVASSIAHLYERPRVWLEGYHSSGWGTSSGDVVDATIANFLQGQNLLTFHGLYYSTHGGWWEWAPPENHWRMPYWAHMDAFYALQQRLSYLLSQGTHVADVAVIYPVAPVEADMDGQVSVRVAFESGEGLFGRGIDFDFMDFESLERARKAGGLLKVAGEAYRVLVLPSMKAVRHSTLVGALKFARAGGIVVAVGALPEASDRKGRDDPEVARLVQAIFGISRSDGRSHRQEHTGGGLGLVDPDVAQAIEAISKAIPHDVRLAEGAPAQFMHHKIGPRNVYALYGVDEGSTATFRATGKAELWDPWTGATRPLPVTNQEGGFTTLRLPLSRTEVKIVAFSPGAPVFESPAEAPAVTVVPIDGTWTCEPKPTLDNRWGDFHWPPTDALIGPEARRFRYRDDEPGSEKWSEPNFDDSAWETVTCGFGAKFLMLGPLSAVEAGPKLERRLLEQSVPPSREYAFSWFWGVEGDRGHQGYHGLKELTSSHFIRLGNPVVSWPGEPSTRYAAETAGPVHYLWSSVLAPRAMTARLLIGGLKPVAAWINGRRLDSADDSVRLAAGPNRVLLRYDEPGTGYFVAVDPAVWGSRTIPDETAGLAGMPWSTKDGVLPFDVKAGAKERVGWFRFKAPPGLKRLELTTSAPTRCWIDGQEVVARGKKFELPAAARREAVVCLRLEQEPGEYAGNAITDPIRLSCEEGEIGLGDWSNVEGLRCYSGGLWYRKSVDLVSIPAGSRVFLDLGRVVSSAEVHVNGKGLGAKLASPWKWDITEAIHAGQNRIEVLVYNTLANHYLTIPTGYRGDSTSGLLGPARLLVVK